jgi:pimeloyl-ACP methyl ester carboxylesterase
MKARGIEFRSKVSGDDDPTGGPPPLLWGHALMGSMSQEEDAGIMPWAGLGDSARLVRWDARGHGGSEASLAEDDYRWAELAKDLWAIADSLGIERAVVGGVSMGAGTALHAAMLAPERTRGLVLMAPPTAWDTRPRQAALYRNMARMIGLLGLGPFRLGGELVALTARNRSLARLQRSVTRGLRSASPRAVQCALRGAARSDLPTIGSLEKLEVPTLILAWPDDWSHPLATADELLARLPNARLEVEGKTSELQAWPGVLRSFLDSL